MLAISTLLEDEPARLFGRDAKAEMVRVGERVEKYVDVEGVSKYLDGKVEFYDDERVMLLRIRVPVSANAAEQEMEKGNVTTWKKAQARARRTHETVVKIDVERFIERLDLHCGLHGGYGGPSQGKDQRGDCGECACSVYS